MWLLVGLGNIGIDYENTRHNLGFKIIDSLEKKFLQKLKINTKFQAYYVRIPSPYSLILAKPITFMNNSGQSVKIIQDYYKIPINKIIAIHDDIDLALGKIKIKTGGSSAGHNGIRSMDQCIGHGYNRIRIGIGRPIAKNQISNFVLSKFNREEEDVINNTVNFITENIELILKNLTNHGI